MAELVALGNFGVLGLVAVVSVGTDEVRGSRGTRIVHSRTPTAAPRAPRTKSNAHGFRSH